MTKPNIDMANATIEDLNEEEAKLYLGGAVLVCILSVIGVIGNLHVLLVYAFRMKPSNHRVFILCLAILDMITCSIGMPFVFINFRKPFTFYDSVICKILTLNNFFICISSAGVLLVIAVDRYRKICVPHGKQMSKSVAKAMCLVALGISLLLSWPAIVLYGSTPIETRVPDIIGHECNVLIHMRDTNYPVYFNGALLIVAFSSFIVLAILYSFIGRAIWQHRTLKSKIEETTTEVTHIKMNDMQKYNTELSESSDSNELKESTLSDTPSDTTNTFENTAYKGEQNVRSRSNHVKNAHKRRSLLLRQLSKIDRTQRTTLMLLWITIVFFISYVPYLTLRIASYMNPDWYTDMSYTEKVTYNTFLWCVFINNMSNSIIYGFCDQRFRQQVKKSYSRIFCRE